MKKSISWAAGMALAGLTAFTAPAQAALVNGGFERGDFSGWTQTGETDFNFVLCTPGDPTVYSGDCSAWFGPSSAKGGIQQVVETGGAGRPWNLSFAFKPDGAPGSSFEVMFGGQTLLSLLSPLEGDYAVYRFSGLTAGSNMTLAFNFFDAQGFLLLDNVTLLVPEPATLGLLGAGLAGLLFARRRKNV